MNKIITVIKSVCSSENTQLCCEEHLLPTHTLSVTLATSELRGIPQGSVAAPLLFDLPRYADDTQLFFTRAGHELCPPEITEVFLIPDRFYLFPAIIQRRNLIGCFVEMQTTESLIASCSFTQMLML